MLLSSEPVKKVNSSNQAVIEGTTYR